jgi:hypothetical protein
MEVNKKPKNLPSGLKGNFEKKNKNKKNNHPT